MKKQNLNLKDYLMLLKLSKRLNKVFTSYCNGEISEEKMEKKTRIIEEKVKEITKNKGYFYYIQQDPRGVNIYISTKKLDYKNYTEGEAIY